MALTPTSANMLQHVLRAHLQFTELDHSHANYLRSQYVLSNCCRISVRVSKSFTQDERYGSCVSPSFSALSDYSDSPDSSDTSANGKKFT
uniref:Uncharacterized protein n=1 Tax=Timema genevievae TaxID=629358 RepID=A0A7R9JNS6_TIMGE|nr:unnamed protein product [Timema genevievae]